jgi:hypothetical protein
VGSVKSSRISDGGAPSGNHLHDAHGLSDVGQQLSSAWQQQHARVYLMTTQAVNIFCYA